MSYIPLFYIYLYYSVRNTHLLYCYSQLDSRKVTFVFIYFLKPMKGEMSIDGRKTFLFSHFEIVCDMNHELHIQYDALDINTLYLDTIREPAFCFRAIDSITITASDGMLRV